jgi:hypothetical protein
VKTTAAGQDTDNAALGGLETIRDLETSIAPMLLDTTLRDVTLNLLKPAERKIATRALQHASRLHNSTEWSDEELLARLGCTLTAERLPDVRLPKLQRCEHFLSLVDRLVGCVDTTRDRRAVVLACAKLLRTTGNSRALQEAFEHGPFSAIDYLRLGEISAASDRVREHVGKGRRVENPYASAPKVHLSAPRLGMFIHRRRDLIGDSNVFDRVGAHIAECEACRQAYDRHRAGRQSDSEHS